MFYKKAAKNDKISVAFLENRPFISQLCSNLIRQFNKTKLSY